MALDGKLGDHWSYVARPLSTALNVGERSGSTHTHSGVEAKTPCLVCSSLNQSQLSWAVQSPGRCDCASAK